METTWTSIGRVALNSISILKDRKFVIIVSLIERNTAGLTNLVIGTGADSRKEKFRDTKFTAIFWQKTSQSRTFNTKFGTAVVRDYPPIKWVNSVKYILSFIISKVLSIVHNKNLLTPKPNFRVPSVS